MGTPSHNSGLKNHFLKILGRGGVSTYYTTSHNMHQTLHENLLCMSPACYVSVIAKCVVHTQLFLTCICPYCNMHVVLTCATHD